jgi:M6 family metalloprotease-like protein
MSMFPAPARSAFLSAFAKSFLSILLPIAALAAPADERLRELNSQVLTLQSRTISPAVVPGANLAFAERARELSALIVSDPTAAAASAFPAEVLDALGRAFPDDRALLEQRGGWQGQLEVLIEDDLDLQSHRPVFRLLRGREVLELHFAGRTPNSLNSGMRVVARGVRLDRLMAVTELEWLDAPLTTSGSSAGIAPDDSAPEVYPASCGPSGAQNVLTVLVNLPGYTLPASVTPELVKGAVLGNAHTTDDVTPDWNVDAFWREGSDGKAWIDPTNSLVYGPVKLNSNFNKDSSGSNYCDNYGLRDAVIKAVDANVDFKRFSRIQIVMPANGACSWAGTANVGCRTLSSAGDGQFNASVAWLRADTMQSRSRAVQLMSHENGHNLGLYHASSRDFGNEPLGAVGSAGSIGEYGDPHSTMGSWNFGFYAASHAANLLGWLGAANVEVVQSSGTYTIQNYEGRPAGLKALKVRRGSGNDAWLWIESRRDVGNYSSQLNSQVHRGALIHYEDSRTGGASHLLDFTPGTDSFADAALEVGEAWTDPYSDLAIRVDDITPAAMTVTVTYGAPVCSRAAPTVSVSPAVASTGAGSQLSGTVTVRNNSSSACASETFNLTSATPAGWTASSANASLTIAPGQQAQTALTVAVPADQAPGTFDVRPRAASASSGKADTATLAVTVTGVVCTNAAPSITLSPGSLSARAGETSTTTVTIRNDSSAACPSETIRLSSNLPSGWTRSFSKTSHTLAPGQQAQATLTVGAPASQPAGSINVAISARGIDSSLSGSADLGFTVLAASCTRVAPTVTLTPSALSAFPGSSVETTVRVQDRNDSRCSSESYRLAVTLPAGWSGSFAEPTLQLSPGATGSTTLTVNVPDSAEPGDVSLATTATGTSSGIRGGTAADLSIESGHCTRAAPTVTVSPVSASIRAGRTATAVATIRNNSSPACGTETYVVRVPKPKGWTREISASPLTIEPGESARSTISLTSPETQPLGVVEIRVRGRSTTTGLSGLAMFPVTTVK